ncbi:MAG: YegS/Rv2252/BmrU family lipid kinase [Bacteroidota bacterium]
MDKKFAIIINPKSGKGHVYIALSALKSTLNAHSFLYTVFENDLPENLDGFTDLIILGGDGTLNYTINWFKQINIPIALIACGTGNDFAYCLYGNSPLTEQIDLAIFGKIQSVDAGACNEKLFLNGVGIGFDGEVAHHLYAKKYLKGKLAYMASVIPLLFVYKETQVSITTDNFSYKGPLFMLSAANGKRYGGGFYVTPNALITDKLLNLMLVTKASLLKRLLYLPYIEKGKHVIKAPVFVKQNTFTQFFIEADKPIRAHLDGEAMVAQQFTVQALPHYFQFKMK